MTWGISTLESVILGIHGRRVPEWSYAWLSHFYISFRLTRALDCRCFSGDKRVIWPISKMWLDFSPFLLYVNPSLLSNTGVLQWWMLDFLIRSHGEWWSCVSHRDECCVTPKLSEILVRKLEPSPPPCKCCRHTSQHYTVTSLLTSLLSWPFLFYSLIPLTLLMLMPHVFQQRSEIETVWCCRDFWIFFPISQMLVLSCKMFV